MGILTFGGSSSPLTIVERAVGMLTYVTVVIAVLFGCVSPVLAQDQRAEMNKRIIVKLFQDATSNNVERVAAALHPQYMARGVGWAGLGYPQDVAGDRRAVDRRALPDIHAAAPA